MHSIVEVSRKTRLSSRTLRVWQEEGLLQGTRDESGMRLFSSEVFDCVDKIQLLKNFGFTLKQIRDVLSGEATATVHERLQEKRLEIEHESSLLLATQRKLQQVDELLGGTTTLLSSMQSVALQFVEKLVATHPRLQQKKYQNYLQDELGGANPDELASWFTALNRVLRYAREHEVPTRFVRGYAASSLLLSSLGWTTIDPLTENLVPHSPFRQDLHFDIPFSGVEHFFDFLQKVNQTLDKTKIVAFRLPILGIIQNFAERTQTNPFEWESETRMMDLLAKGQCQYVFGIDETGESMMGRLYADVPKSAQSVSALSQDLVRLKPTTRDDVFKFLALRRLSTWDAFLSYLNREPSSFVSDRIIAKDFEQENKGYVFFREELLKAMHCHTGWDYSNRLAKIRADASKGQASDTEANAFISKTDKASLDFVAYWGARAFHKAHLVGWWQLMATTLTCKLRNESEWKRVIGDWEHQHGLKWNDFGVVLPNAKLLSSM